MSSIDLSLSGSIRNFFTPLPEKGLLLLTTFGLDEIVLEALLKDAGVPQQYRIVVFHDIIRHCNPGFLRASFPYSKTIAVRLPATKDYPCPVFHSKIWILLSPKGRVCRLAVHSINLTRYHLAAPSQTLESFWSRRDLDLPLPRAPLFGSLAKWRSTNRISSFAETWIIRESSDGTVSFKRSTGSAGNAIADVIRDDVRHRARCGTLIVAAPFVSREALKSLCNDAGRYLVRSGPIQEKKRSACLHAKVLVGAGTTIAGSANFTQQALRVFANPVNHETVLILKRRPGRLASLLTRIPLMDNDGPTIKEEPGDDPELIGTRAWNEARRLAQSGPVTIRLELDSRATLVQIRLAGSLHGARMLSIRSAPVDDEEPRPPLFLSARKGLIRVSASREARLAEIVLQGPPVFVEGRRNRKGRVLWKRELDLGDLWNQLQAWKKSSSHLVPVEPPDPQNGNRRKKPERPQFIDIRDIRERVLAHETTNIGWLSWILRHQKLDPALHEIPDWIHRLKEKVDSDV